MSHKGLWSTPKLLVSEHLIMEVRDLALVVWYSLGGTEVSYLIWCVNYVIFNKPNFSSLYSKGMSSLHVLH